ncbi:MAG: abortive infection family protein [Eubacteriales bacterium]
MDISEVTRRDIIDSLSIENVHWAGRLEEPDFIARLFNTQELHSTDNRFDNFYSDIWQHRMNNYDWDDDWIFYDPRTNLFHCDDQLFLRFLCETIHPVVRPTNEEVIRLLQLYNLFLRNNGYEIVEKTRMSGKPVFVGRKVILSSSMSIESLRSEFKNLDAEYISQQITRMEAAVNSDVGLAIGTAKELIETCCKTIISERSGELNESWDLPKLVKATVKLLKLTPSDIKDSAKASDTIKVILSNLATITNGISELRNKYGTGHGKESKSKGLSPRHAKLSVGAASTLAIFLYETHKEQND